MSEMQEESKINESYAPMLEHLDELRTRIVRCALALLLGMVVCFALFQQQLTEIVMGPFMALEQDMIYTQFAEGFMFQLKIALLGGVVMASPVIIWQIMRFILPALYSNEKRVFLLMTFFGILLFVGGVCFGYFLVLEPIMQTLIKLAGTDLTPMITAKDRKSVV